MTKDHMFSDFTAWELLQEQRQNMENEILNLGAKEISNRDENELADYYAKKYLAVLPVIGDGPYPVDHFEFLPGVSTIPVRVHIPFTGQQTFFKASGNRTQVVFRDFRIANHEVVITYEVGRNDPASFARERDGDLEKMRFTLNEMVLPVKRHNDALRELALAAIRKRTSEVQRDSQFMGALPSHNFSLRVLDDPVARVMLTVSPTPLSFPEPKPGEAPNRELSGASYDKILQVIDSMSKAFERSPRIFQKMPEEWLRDILLVGLNANLRGRATGETFNGAGKTDILIREEDKNVFIAECLIWDGPGNLRSKIDDQLLKYATWRDEKLALIIFNRNKNFTDVVAKMNAVIDGHPQKIRKEAYAHETGCRYLFRRKDDPAKHFLLTALAFDIPPPSEAA